MASREDRSSEVVARREQSLAEIVALLDKGDTDQTYLIATRRIWGIVKKVADRVCVNVESAIPNRQLAMRCIARKAEETLASIVSLIELDHNYAATSLLRQMCEELIFAEYLFTLSEEDANQFLKQRTTHEVVEGIQAQDEFFSEQQKFHGQADISDPRTTVRATEELRAAGAEASSRLKEMGKRIGWGNRVKPTTKDMADKAGIPDVYNFFYHASCGSVHACLHHLFRMAWKDGRTGQYKITNANFSQYYRRFSLVYGSWLASRIILTIQKAIPGSFPQEEEEAFSICLAIFVIPAIARRAPPIVTAEELYS